METLKHPACNIGWVAWCCCSWLSLGKATRISHGKNSIGTAKLSKNLSNTTCSLPSPKQLYYLHKNSNTKEEEWTCCSVSLTFSRYCSMMMVGVSDRVSASQLPYRESDWVNRRMASLFPSPTWQTHTHTQVHRTITFYWCSNQQTKGINIAWQALPVWQRTQQQIPELPTVTVTWHVNKYKVHKLHQRYIVSLK